MTIDWLTALTTEDLVLMRGGLADLAKYNEDQPREPAGSPEGGRFASAPGGGDLEQRAKEMFGVTRDIREAGYMTPDGSLLDFSGRHYSTGYHRESDHFVPDTHAGGRREPDYFAGERNVDHREVGELLPDERETDEVTAMLNAGFVRLMEGGYLIANMGAPLTSGQWERLAGYAHDAVGLSNGGFAIEVMGPDGRTVYTANTDDTPGLRPGTMLREANEAAIAAREAPAATKAAWRAIAEAALAKSNPYHEPAGSPEGGRFASADGGLQSAIDAYTVKYPEPPRLSPVQVAEQMGMSEAALSGLVMNGMTAEQVVSFLGLDKPIPTVGTNMASGDPERCATVLRTLDRMQQEFPGARVATVDIRDLVGGFRQDRTVLALTSGSAIFLSDLHFGAGTPAIERSYEGAHVKGCDNPEGYAVHEYGHVVDNGLMAGGTKGSEYTAGQAETYAQWRQTYVRDGAPVSGYARDPAPSGYEKVAECFTAAFAPQSGQKDDPGAVSLRDLLMDLGVYQPAAAKVAGSDLLKYREDQAREPAGSPEGGRFAGVDEPLVIDSSHGWGQSVSDEGMPIVLPEATVDDLSWAWQGQADQHPATDTPGFHFRVEEPGKHPIEILLHYGEDKALNGILYCYPKGMPGYEDRGAINMWADPERQRQGIGTSLLREFESSHHPIDWYAQSFSPAGRATAAAYLRSTGQVVVDEIAKGNPYHDERGRFTTADGAGGSLYISVPAGAIPVGSDIHYGPPRPEGWQPGDRELRQRDGGLIRGETVISPNDPRIPDTVYHVTTNLPAVQESGRLLAGGKGGLGGDAQDRIVSMTIDRGIAEQLADDIRLKATADASPEPWKVYTAQAEAEGWGTKWLASGPLGPDGAPRLPGYSAHDWDISYFITREYSTGVRNPVFFESRGATPVDPANVVIVAVPRENLDNGALLVDFDLTHHGGLQEIRSYGDVPLKGATFTKAAEPALTKGNPYHDERGRFTTADGGDGLPRDWLPEGWSRDPDMLRGPDGMPKSEGELARKRSEAVMNASASALNTAHPGTLYYAPMLSSLNAELAKPAIEQIGHLQGIFPGVRLAEVTCDTNRTDPRSLAAWTDHVFDGEKPVIVLDIPHFDPHLSDMTDAAAAVLQAMGKTEAMAAWDRGRRPGWLVDWTPEGVATHEFGHAVMAEMLSRVNDGRVAQGSPEAEYMRTFGQVPAVSGYGAKDATENWAEMFTKTFGIGAADEGTLTMRHMLAAAGVMSPEATSIYGAPPGTVLKYNESQPRVPAGSPEGGEFAGGGASSPADWTSKDDARAWFAASLPDTHITSLVPGGGVVDKMHLANLRQFAMAYERVAKTYPLFAAGLRVTSVMVRPQDRGVLASWIGKGVGNRTLGIMQVSPKTAMQPNALARAMAKSTEEGFHPPGCDDFQSVIEHELGHAFANWLTSSGRWKADGGGFDITSGRWPSPSASGGYGLYQSGYATRNSAEWFAEQFSGALAADRPLSAENHWGFEHPAAPKVEKSNPYHDERGRFTFADGGGAMSPEAYAASHPGTVVDLRGGMEVKETAEALGQLSRLQAAFPEVHITKVESSELAALSRPLARCPQATRDRGPDSRIELSTEHWATAFGYDLYKDSHGFHPAGTDNPAGIITHEFGHAVQRYLDYQQNDGTPEMRDRIFTSYGRLWWGAGLAFGRDDNVSYGPTGAYRFAQKVSGYAMNGPQEAWSEMFCAAYAPGSEQADTKLSVDLRQALQDSGVWTPATKVATITKADPTPPRTVTSGGPKRDAALNPIVDKTKAALLLLVAQQPKQQASSPLTLSDSARAILYAAYLEALRTGYDAADGGDDGWDDTQASADASDRADHSLGWALGLGAAIAVGAITYAMVNARMAQWAASLNPVYERGFAQGVSTQGTITSATWHTEEDDATCFVAGTMVATPTGEVPIDRLRPGDSVLTHAGVGTVAATSARSYPGELVAITAAGKTFVATEGHPVFVNGRWLAAGRILPGDRLEGLEHQSVYVERIDHLPLGEMGGTPSMPDEESVLRRIGLGVSVPVRAVHFKGDVADGEVDGASTFAYVNLGLVADSQTGEAAMHGALQPILPSVSPIAADGAEESVATRALAFLDAARPAAERDDGPIAQFGAISLPHYCPEWQAAALAGTQQTRWAEQRCAGGTSPSLALGESGREGGATINAGPGEAAAEASPRAEPRRPAPWDESPSALLAGGTFGYYASSLVPARRGAVAVLPPVEASGERRAAALTDVVDRSPGHGVTVYNLEVEEAHTFYVEGVLVHNCDLCEERDGQVWYSGEPHPFPGEGGFGGEVCSGGPHCRCEIWYEIVPAAEAGLGGILAGALAGWAVASLMGNNEADASTLQVEDSGWGADYSDDLQAAATGTLVKIAAFLRSQVQKFNPNHEPAGSPEGGEFASADGGGPTVISGPGVREIADRMGANLLDVRQETRPDLYMKNPRGWDVRNDKPAPRIRASADGRPRIVDSVPDDRLGMGEQDVPGSERPPDHLFRAVSEEEWQNAQRNGYLQSDQRMNLSQTEGTVAALTNPTWYLPGNLASDAEGDHPGRLLRIAYNDADGWRLDPVDGYVKTNERIPIDRVDAISPPIITTNQVIGDRAGGNFRIQTDVRIGKVLKFNPYHEPAGSPQGGEFASADGGPVGDNPARGAPLPADFDSWPNDRAIAYFDDKRARGRVWSAAMDRAVALGKVSPKEAEARGWMPNVRGGIEGVVPLPPDLYHATTAMDSVLRDGLKTRDELGGKHALGGGDEATISFTTDPAIAARIAEVMVEAHDVATGAITPEDLLARAEAGGFKSNMVDLAHGQDNIDRIISGQKYDYSSMAKTLDEANADGAGWKPVLSDPNWMGGDGAMRYTGFERPTTPDEQASARLDLYRGPFLSAQEYYGHGPMDPLIWAPDAKFFQSLDPAQVGVVHAQPIPGAMGFQMSGLGEWRTWSGDAVTVAAVKGVRSTLWKSNPYHDEAGRFTTADGAAAPKDPHEKAWESLGRDVDSMGMGNCYGAALTIALESDELGLKNVVVCHATVTPDRGPLKDVLHGHAWAEADVAIPGSSISFRMAYDYSSRNRAMLPAEYYRQLGHVSDVHEYSREEALVLAVQTGHYGPWDE